MCITITVTYERHDASNGSLKTTHLITTRNLFLHRLQKKCTWYFRLTSHISTTRTSFPSMLRNVYKCNFFSHWPRRRYKMRPGCLVIQKSNKSWIKTVSVWIHSLSISWQGPTQWQIFRKLYGVIDALFEKRFLSPSIWYNEIYKLP